VPVSTLCRFGPGPRISIQARDTQPSHHEAEHTTAPDRMPAPKPKIMLASPGASTHTLRWLHWSCRRIVTYRTASNLNALDLSDFVQCLLFTLGTLVSRASAHIFHGFIPRPTDEAAIVAFVVSCFVFKKHSVATRALWMWTGPLRHLCSPALGSKDELSDTRHKCSELSSDACIGPVAPCRARTTSRAPAPDSGSSGG